MKSLTRLEEMPLIATEDVAAITAEATAVLAEIALMLKANSQWKGTDIFGTSTTVKFGKSGWVACCDFDYCGG